MTAACMRRLWPLPVFFWLGESAKPSAGHDFFL
jgi:hypothetical protein